MSFPAADITRGAEARLVKSLDLRRMSLSPDLAERQGVWHEAPVTITTRIYQGEPVAWARFAIVEGEGLQIGNIVCLPHREHPLPILGADLVAIRADRAMVAIDLSPTLPPGQERDGQLTPLAARLAQHPPLPSGGDLPAWCARWFSPHAVYARGTPEALRDARPVVQIFVEEMIDLAGVSVPCPDLASQTAATIDGYLASHREDDNGLNLLAAMFGRTWMTAYIRSALFPSPDGSVLRQ